MTLLRVPEIRNDSSKVRLERLSHVYFDHPDLEKSHKFAEDFDLVLAHRDGPLALYRGYSKDQYCSVAHESDTPAFGGGAFVAQTQADFDKAAAMDGAVVSDFSSFPGGGRKVSLKSPSGFPFHVIFGQEDRAAIKSVPSAQVDHFGTLNGSLDKRRLGRRCLSTSYFHI